MKITEKQKLFCEYYIIDLVATNAAKKAGYSEANIRQSASILMKKPVVKKYIDKLMKKRAKKIEITQDRVLAEYAKLAFFNPQKLYDDIDGEMIPIQDLDPDVASAISSFKNLTIKNKVTEESIGYETDLKFCDKKSALDSLARHLGMFNDKVSLGGQKDNPISVSHTQNIDLTQFSDEELEQLERIATKSQKDSTESE